MTTRLSSSSTNQPDDVSLLLVTDVAGMLHCYRFHYTPSPSLQRLWMRRLDGEEDDALSHSSSGSCVEQQSGARASRTQNAKDVSDKARFQCIISKRLTQLQSPRISLSAVTANKRRSEQLSTAVISVDTNIFEDESTSASQNRSSPFHMAAGSSSNTEAPAYAQPLAAAIKQSALRMRCTGPAAGSTTHLAAGTHELQKNGQPAPVHSNGRDKRTPSAGAPPNTPPARCLFCFPDSFSSPTSTEISVSATTQSTSTLPSPLLLRSAEKAHCGDKVAPTMTFQRSDFMARVPDPHLSTTLPACLAATEALHPQCDGATRDTWASAVAPDATAPVPALASDEEVRWYWRSSRSASPPSDLAPHSVASGRSSAVSAEQPSHARWVSLPEAVRHWNESCCRHHRILLLRKMEEAYQEVDLLTGELLSVAGVSSDPFALAELSSMDSSPVLSRPGSDGDLSSFGSRSSGSDETSPSSTSSSNSAVATAVLSLTTRRYQTLLMQKPYVTLATKGKMKLDMKARACATVKTVPTCLLKLTAPTVHFGVTWYPSDLAAAGKNVEQKGRSGSSDDNTNDEEAYISTASPSTAAPHHMSVNRRRANSSSTSSSNSTSSHHNSTSASDIDMDVLSGRKKLPSKYHAVRAMSSDSTDSTSSSSSSSASSVPRQVRSKLTSKKRLAVEAHDKGYEESDDGGDVPVRCGPGGEVYLAKDLLSVRDMSHSEDDDEEPRRFPQPLLQLRIPFVQAVWVRLPSSSYAFNERTDNEDGGAVDGKASHTKRELTATNGAVPFAVNVHPVPWVLVRASVLRTMEVVDGAQSDGLQSCRATDTGLNLRATDEAVIGLRGFLLNTEGTLAARNASAALDCPLVLRPLGALDVLNGKNGNPAGYYYSLPVIMRNSANAEVTRNKLRGRKGGAKDDDSDSWSAEKANFRRHTSPGTVMDTCSYAERERCAREYPKAHVQREAIRHFNSGEQSRSSFSSLPDDASVTHCITPPPLHFTPVSSFFDENFEPLTILGRGVGGAVLLARHRFTGVFYAVKVLVARDYESERDILQEVRVHAMLENKYVVRYHACWSEVITSTRAQQLAFIGVCSPHEASLARQRHLAAPSSSTARAGGQRSRSNIGERTSSLARPPRAPFTPWLSAPHSEDDLTRRAGAARTRSAPGGWDRLILPSHSSMLLIGSESASETVSPISTVARPRGKLRSARWSTAIVDEYAGAGEEEEDEEDEESSERDSEAWAMYPLPESGNRTRLRRESQPLRAAVADTRARFTRSARKSESDDTTDAESESADESPSPERSEQDEGRTIVGSRVVFLQMEFCQITLAHQLSSRASINRVENLLILLQIVAGLRYLHSRGVLHRDLKPTNVFMDYRCQYDKVVHGPNSSSTSSNTSTSTSNSSDYGSDGEDAKAEAWAMSPLSTRPRQNTSARAAGAYLSRKSSWAESSENRTPNACTALSLQRQRPFPLTSQRGGRGGAARLPNVFPSMDPVMAMQLNTGNTTFDSLPTWDGERSALDVVLHTAHQEASVLLQKRLLRRPPPQPPRRSAGVPEALLKSGDGANHAAGAQSGTASATASLARYSEGKVFLRRLANWLCHHFVQVRLGDFGLAKFLYQQDIGVDGFVSMNASNTIGVGSPLYASPEQLKGNRCTPASDAFSMGVMMAEMYLQPTTIAERLTVLREVRDGVYEDAGLFARYPELKLVRRLTLAQPKRRVTLSVVQTVLKAALLKALQDEI